LLFLAVSFFLGLLITSRLLAIDGIARTKAA